MKKPKVLRKLVVTEVSSVTRAANPGAQILLMKRDDGSAAPKATETPSQVSSHVSHLADLIVEAGGGRVSRAEAISFLLSTPAGQAIIRTTKRETPEKEQPMIQNVLKQFGLISVSKSMIEEQSSFGLSEHDFTALISEYAKTTKRADESDAAAFEREFTTNDTLKKAYAVVKNSQLASLQPTQVGGNDALDTDPDGSKAMEQLRSMSDELRRKSPFLSVAQAFARTFEDPANAAIAARAHKRPTATTAFAFPR